ncbi:ABC transporter permease [Terrimonas sp.]|uniref:ABC transporter permease n=1 Tax=Terrimonas sp. TaxID=1914338 RepID=UPI000D50C2CA|nr:FtsX-like permease family protein [Terrimonas sp.]PVD52061.1 ABC transporter permease [Terrimonas sp.]
MFRHLFKIIWNKKKQNFLLITEMLISFLVMFAVFTMLVHFYRNYRTPMGMQYEHVWVINYNNTLKTQNKDSIMLFYEGLKQTIRSMPQVKGVSYSSGNVPFSQNTMMSGYEYNGKHINPNLCRVDKDYTNVLHIQVTEGEWFGKNDISAKARPVVINNKIKQDFFGNESPVGKFLGKDSDLKIIGVVDDTKMKGDYTDVGYWLYDKIDMDLMPWTDRILVDVTPNADAAFEGQLYKTVAGMMKDSNIEIEHLTNKLKDINYWALVPMITLSIIACFLIINVALGLFGVLWYNINKRRGEIGLRRAVGATAMSVSSQLVAEALILATFSLIIGSFFAVQFPILNVFDLPAGVYLTALLLAIVFIYVLVLICSLYPGRQAAGIYPAVALHEE